LGTSSDEIARQIAETREGIEGRIVILRERGEVAVERGKRVALIAAGVGAGIAVVAVGAFVVWRMTRPPSTRERVERVIPHAWWERARELRRRVPSVRVAVEDEEARTRGEASTAQKFALRFASAAGTAIGAALVRRVLQRFERAA
jgi:hypothetical protein